MTAYEDDADALCRTCGATYDVHELLSPWCDGEGAGEYEFSLHPSDNPHSHFCPPCAGSWRHDDGECGSPSPRGECGEATCPEHELGGWERSL